jgi:hypothetical protein
MMQCLVCGGPAEDITPGEFDGIVMKCPACGPYDVAGTVQAKLAKLGLKDRAAVLQKAKGFSTFGTRPTITSTTF